LIDFRQVPSLFDIVPMFDPAWQENGTGKCGFSGLISDGHYATLNRQSFH